MRPATRRPDGDAHGARTPLPRAVPGTFRGRAMHAAAAVAVLAGLCAVPGAAAAQQVSGVVVDRDSGDPVATATVTLLDTADTAVATAETGADGAFTVMAPAAGRYRFRVERLGYATQTMAAPVRLEAGESAAVTLRVSAEALPLNAVVVRGRTQQRQAELERGTPARILDRDAIEEMIRTTAPRDVGDVVRRFPDVTVRTMLDGSGRDMVCVESAQRIQHSIGCDMVLVIFNGSPVEEEPGSFLRGLSPEELESIEFMKPSEAGVYYGTRGGNGVLLLNSRGGGRYADRDRLPRQEATGRLGFTVGAGAAAGAGGLVLGALVACGVADCPFGSLSTGAAATEAVTIGLTIPLAAHIAGGRRGPLWLEMLASTAIGAAGVAAWDATGQGAFLIAVPVLQLGTSVVLERR